MLIIDGLLTSVLVDTGSSISVISLSICKRLRKVLPPQGPVLRSTFNAISAPTAAATSRFVVNGASYPTEFPALTESSHDVILRYGFLSNNEAVIGYVRNEILLLWQPCTT